MSKTGSISVIPLLSFTLPMDLYALFSSKVNTVGNGPSYGTVCEYKCQLASIEAFEIKSYSVSDIFIILVDHDTGSRICD
jgi:hypothetical protein